MRNECAESVKGVRVVLEREKTEALESVGGSAIRRLDDLKKEWEAREKASLVALERDLRETHERDIEDNGASKPTSLTASPPRSERKIRNRPKLSRWR